MSVFDPEDGFVESFPFDDGNYGWVWNGAIVDGSLIHRPWWDGTRRQIRVYDLTMTLVDSIPLPSDEPEDEEYDPERQPGTFYQALDRGYMMYGIPFFAGEVRHIDSRGGMWSTRDGDPAYRLSRWEPGGDTILVVETRRPAVPVTEVERDSVIAAMREMLAARGVTSQWDWSRIPNVKPAVEAIFQSAEGNLWVRTPSADGGVLFDVYSLAVRRYAEKPPERLEMASEPRKQAVVCPIRSGTLLSWTPAKPHRRVCTLKVPKPRISAVTYVATPISSRRRSPCRPVRYSRPWRNRRASTNPDHPSARGPGSQA